MVFRNDRKGGAITSDTEKSLINKSGKSHAKFVGQPNEDDWKHEGEVFKDAPARQCAAQDFFNRHCVVCDTVYNMSKSVCPECGSTEHYLKRCINMAEPNYETCSAHGGGMVPSKEHRDKYVASKITNGFSVSEILFCTKTCPIVDSCQFKSQCVDVERYGSTVPRCLPEQSIYDAIQVRFRDEYELDEVADQIMLDSLAMAIVRRARGQKILASQGELVERVRTSPDGSYETWLEPNAISNVVDSLDKRVQAWLKELAVSKAAREGKKVNVNGTINLLNILSGPIRADGIDEERIIDIDLEE